MADEKHVRILKSGVKEWNKYRFERLGTDFKPDLSHADLSHLDLSYANLEDADLSNADLSHAKLTNAYLSGASLRAADLSHANLSACLEDAAITQEDEELGIMCNTIMTITDPNDYVVKGLNENREKVILPTDLSNTDLTETNFTHARLCGVNFERANLSRAKMDKSVLAQANFADAILTEASFSGADLRRAYFVDGVGSISQSETLQTNEGIIVSKRVHHQSPVVASNNSAKQVSQFVWAAVLIGLAVAVYSIFYWI